MKTLPGIAEISPCWTASSHHSPPCLSGQPLISSSLLVTTAATLAHPCSVALDNLQFAYSLWKPYQEPRRVRPLFTTVSDTDADMMLAGVLTLCECPADCSRQGWGKQGRPPVVGAALQWEDICMQLISHTALTQKPFNCFQPSSTLWFPLTGPLLCFA